MAIRAYCRIPKIKKKTLKPKEGGCPELLSDLMGELDGASEIHIAAYLFNNPVYFSFLSKLAANGCNIYITTLPERGYSDKKLKVDGYPGKISGRDMAKEIFSEIENINNISLRFFPHQYIWYGALYAGGGASYSFHVKAIYAKFSSGQNKCILSTGNFMFTDPYHSDSLLVFEGEPGYEKVFEKFFSDLEGYSTPSEGFKTKYEKYEEEFMLSFAGREENLHIKGLNNCFFTAPFYFIKGLGSNHYVGNRIISLIEQAEHRIWACAQHFHDVASYDRERETIVNALYKKSRQSTGIELRFLKQVPNSSLADKRRAAITETLFQHATPTEQRFNRLAHDKFMLIDDTLVFSTANYTPTQFAFGLRDMSIKNKEGEKVTKKDNFSEVNGFAIVQNCQEDLMSQFENHFNNLWAGGEDIRIDL